MNYEELVGKYINGFFIEKVEKDPFIEGQINLYTDSKKEDFLGNQAIVKFYITDYSRGASIYQEQVDKENYKLKSIIKEVREYMNKHEIEEVYLDCKLYEIQAYKDILEILDKVEENKND